MAAPSFVEPSSRWGHLSAQLQDQVFVWAGRGEDFKENKARMASTLNVYDPSRESWKFVPVKGTNPPGLYFGGCTAAGNYIYLYGGYDGAHGNCAFHRLDISSQTWTKLPDGMMRLSGAMMVPYKDKIVLFGGYGFNPSLESRKAVRYNSIYTFDTKTSKQLPRGWGLGPASRPHPHILLIAWVAKESLMHTIVCMLYFSQETVFSL